MFDRDRDSKLESVSAATRISKNELLRIPFDEFLCSLGGDPETPDINALQKMLKRTDN